MSAGFFRGWDYTDMLSQLEATFLATSGGMDKVKNHKYAGLSSKHGSLENRIDYTGGSMREKRGSHKYEQQVASYESHELYFGRTYSTNPFPRENGCGRPKREPSTKKTLQGKLTAVMEGQAMRRRADPRSHELRRFDGNCLF